MQKLKIFLIFFLTKILLSDPIEIDVTEGVIEPIPIAITNFNYKSINEKIISNKIYDIISNDLNNSGLFKKISNKAFLQSEEEVFFQPLFKDWSLIDANLIISGELILMNNKIQVKIKLWDVYREKLILSKKIEGISKDNWRTLAHIISNLIYQRVTGEKGYFDTKLVYVSEKRLKSKIIKRITLMDYDGNNLQYLTNGNDLVLTPRFSPDGKTIAFLSYINNKPAVYLLNVNSKEKKLLGSSGALFNIRKKLDKNFLFCNGDTFFDINISDLIYEHVRSEKLAFVALKKIKTKYNYDTFNLDNKNSLLQDFNNKSKMINSGIYILSKKIIPYLVKLGSLEKNVFIKLIKKKKKYQAKYMIENF